MRQPAMDFIPFNINSKAYQHGATRSALDCLTGMTENEEIRLRAVRSLDLVIRRLRDPALQADVMDGAYDDILEALGEARRFGTNSDGLDP